MKFIKREDFELIKVKYVEVRDPRTNSLLMKIAVPDCKNDFADEDTPLNVDYEDILSLISEVRP